MGMAREADLEGKAKAQKGPEGTAADLGVRVRGMVAVAIREAVMETKGMAEAVREWVI
jgi:hypothetical protein